VSVRGVPGSRSPSAVQDTVERGVCAAGRWSSHVPRSKILCIDHASSRRNLTMTRCLCGCIFHAITTRHKRNASGFRVAHREQNQTFDNCCMFLVGAARLYELEKEQLILFRIVPLLGSSSTADNVQCSVPPTRQDNRYCCVISCTPNHTALHQ